MTQSATDWQAREAQVYHQTFARAPVTLVRGSGMRVWDDAGNEYLDFAAGIAVNALGHANPAIADAVAEQARTLVQVSNLFYTTPQVELGERLTGHSALDRVFFVNSGGEATETCVKIARKWGRQNRDGATGVITTLRGFHGRSLAMTAATGTPAYHEPFEPMPAGFTHVPYNDLDAVRDAIDDSTAAVMLELIQAEGGVWVADADYVTGLRELCDEHGILLILDEVQTGIGRTGKLFAYEHFGVTPDLMALAKGLGGGLPIGAALSTERCSVLRPGDTDRRSAATRSSAPAPAWCSITSPLRDSSTTWRARATMPPPSCGAWAARPARSRTCVGLGCWWGSISQAPSAPIT